MDVHGILAQCSLSGLKEDTQGWRAKSPFRTVDGMREDDAKLSLSIHREGMWKCHATGRTGHVVELFAFCTGRENAVGLARMELKRMGLIPRDFVMTRTAGDKEPAEPGKPAPPSLREDVRQPPTEWGKVADERGLSPAVFSAAESAGTLGWSDNAMGGGAGVVFFSASPPLGGEPQEERGAMVRFLANPARKWMTAGAYPVWTPRWKPLLHQVAVVEGQWDALALEQKMVEAGLSGEIQVVALVGGKDVGRHPELMEWFRGKDVTCIPDRDAAGEKILCDFASAMEGVAASTRLVRIPEESGAKDFNEWVQKGLTAEAWGRLWEGREPFFVADNGRVRVVVDGAFRSKHRIRAGEFVLLNDDGVPVRVHEAKVSVDEAYDEEELLGIVSAFPPLAAYVNAASEVSEAPVLWHVMSFLTWFSGVLGRRVRFRSGNNSCLYPMLYTVLVGGSGLGKGQSMGMLRSCVADVAPKEPPFLGSSHFSSESFFDELEEANHRFYSFEEFSEWVPKNESSYKHLALKALIQMYDADRWTESTPFTGKFRKGKNYCIKNPAVAMLAGGIEHQLQEMPEDALRGGLIGRCFFALGKRKHRSIAIPGALDSSVRFEMKCFFEKVFATPFRDASWMDFTDRARIVFEREHARQEKRFGSLDSGSEMQTYLSRWRVHVLKLAMLFELLSGRHAWPLEGGKIAIRESALMASVRLNSILTSCFMQIFRGVMLNDQLSRDGKMQNRIIRWMERLSGPKGVMRSELVRRLQDNPGFIDANLAALVDGGRLISKVVRRGPGRPSTIYYLAKPQQESQDEHEPKPEPPAAPAGLPPVLPEGGGAERDAGGRVDDGAVVEAGPAEPGEGVPVFSPPQPELCRPVGRTSGGAPIFRADTGGGVLEIAP